MYGLAPGEFGKTQPAWEQLVHSDDRAAAVALVKDALETGRPVEGEWRVVWPDGSVHWISGRFQAFKDAEGMPLRLTGVNIDITSQKAAEEALRRSREDLDRAQAVGRIGSWRLDVRGDVLTWSDETYRIFGLPIGTPLTYEAFLSAVHPDDRAFVDAQWHAGLRGEPYDIEHRLLVGGRVKWVREKAFLEYDEAGELLGGFGIAQDVSDRKRTEEALRESEQRYRTIVELADEDLVVSSDGTYSYQESVADDGHTQRGQFRAGFFALSAVARRHRVWVLLVAIAFELAFLIPMGLFPTSRHVLGMPGSLLALTVVITAVLTGWQAGLAAAVAGGAIFWGTVADFGTQSAPITTVVSTGVWVAAALISGLLADALRDQTRKRKSAAVALARAETLREHEAERAAQEERTRIARDLHDSLTQSLFAATLKAEALTQGGDPAQLESVAEDVRRLSRGALAQMRTLLLELRGDPVEEMPLQQLLRNLVEAAESHASVRVILTLEEECALPPKVHEAVYRITQEALNNVVRHSKAENARVQLDVEPSRARLLIGDDGRGFDPASVDGGHFGLKSMRERAAESGGDFTLRSVQGEGTLVTVRYRFEESARIGAAG